MAWTASTAFLAAGAPAINTIFLALVEPATGVIDATIRNYQSGAHGVLITSNAAGEYSVVFSGMPDGTLASGVKLVLYTGTIIGNDVFGWLASTLFTPLDEAQAKIGGAGGLALVGSQMDLVNAPNATAVTAIQSGLATGTEITAAIATINGNTNSVVSAATGTLATAIAGVQTTANAINAQTVKIGFTGTGPYLVNTTAVVTGTVTLASGQNFNNTGQTTPYPAVVALASGTAQAGTATSITLASGDVAPNGAYVGQTIQLISGVGAGQIAQVTAYSSSTKVATIQTAYPLGTWITNPTNATVYAIPGIEWASISFLPFTATLVNPGTVISNVHLPQTSTPTLQWSVVDANGNPVNLSGKYILFTAWSTSDQGQSKVVVCQHDNAGIGGITITGTASNQVNISFTAADTANLIPSPVLPPTGTVQYDLWNITPAAGPTPQVKLLIGVGAYSVRMAL